MAGGSSFANQWTPARVNSAAKVTAAVITAGVLLGLFAAEANLYFVGAGIAAAALAITVAWQFEAALSVYILIAFIPWGSTPAISVGGSGIGRGLYASQIILGFLLVVWVTRYVLSALPKQRIRSGFHIPLLVYMVYSLINVVHSYVFWDHHVDTMYQYVQVNAVELGLRVLSAGAFLMVATSISSTKWLRLAVVAVLVPGLYNLLNVLAGAPIPVTAPWWPLLTILPAGYCLAAVLSPECSVLKRALAAAVVMLAFYAIVINSVLWVSGWLGLLTCFGVVTWMKNRRALLCGLVAAGVAALVFWPFIHHNVFVTSAKEGDYDRFSLFSGAIRYATAFPLGVGLGNYRSYNSFYYGEKWGTTSYTSAHGTYAQHLAEMGLPGLTLFTLFMISGYRWVRKSYLDAPNGPSGLYLAAVAGQMAGVAVAAVIGDYVIPTYHNGGIVTFSASVYSWLAWGLAVAHVRIHGKETHGSLGHNRKLEHKEFAEPLPLVRD